MSTNSLESLLKQMSAGSICHGWGAIAAIGRSQLNRLLEEQYLARLGESRTLVPLSGQVFVGENRTSSVQLDSLVLGKPELSFENASLNSSLITLSMNIVAGTYTCLSRPVNAAPTLLSHFSIREEHGYKVEMQIRLDQFLGEVDRWSRVTLDLASGEDLTTNLGDLPGVQKAIAPLIQAHLGRQTNGKQRFELSLLDLSAYHSFAPAGAYFRTQRAPGAEDPSAPNHGDGCLLLFIRLKIRDEDNLFPGEGHGFPYLIPDNLANGKELFTAALVLNGGWADLVEKDDRLEIPSNLRFAANNVFKESSNGRHKPHDLLVLGNVVPTAGYLKIEPGFISLDGNKAREFHARGDTGDDINVTWSVSNPEHPHVVGEITTSGLYKSLEKSRMYQPQVPLVVTGRYTKEGREYVSSASVLSLYEGMGCSPHIHVTEVGNVEPIRLAVATVGEETLVWPTLTPADGVLEVIDNNHALYTPPATQTESLTVRRIKVQGEGVAAEATVVLLAQMQTLAVTPPFVSVSRSAPVPLKAEHYRPEDCRWSVIGEGSVSPDGIFTPPEDVTSLVSVVKCDIVYDNDGIVRRTGFSIIYLQERQEPGSPEEPEEPEEPHWEKLAHFTITTLGEPKTDRCYANGFQQIPVLVTIETEPVKYNGEDLYIPVSDLELSTLQLVDSEGNILVPSVPPGQEGIEHGSGIQWAVSKAKNRFSEYSATPVADMPPPVSPASAPANNGIRTVRLYVHLAVEGARTFYARFQSDKGAHNSNDSKEPGFEVMVHGIRIPALVKSHYQFEPERVWGNEDGYSQETEQGDPYFPDLDIFSYYRQTIDYWRLNYYRAGSYPIGFATLSFEKNTTTMQWESELLEEKFGSYTGHAFYPARYQHADTPAPAPDRLEFDGSFMLFRQEAMTWAPTKLIAPVSPGELVISLHRTDDMSYWYDNLANGNKYKYYRQLLDGPLLITLMDAEGNRHKLQVEFLNKSQELSRNTLKLTPI